MGKKKVNRCNRIIAGLTAAAAGTGLAIYFGTKLISVPSYTAIRVFEGDQWFCSEREAKEAGFTKAGQCP